MHGDPGRMLWVADPRGGALHLSCGAALFNLRLAIRMMGAKPLVWPLPGPGREPTLLACVQLAGGRPPIPEAVQIGLEQQAGFEFALLRMLSAHDTAVVLELAASADRKLAASFDHRVELGHWIGITGDDGVPARALGSRPDHEPAPVRDFGYAARPPRASQYSVSGTIRPPDAGHTVLVRPCGGPDAGARHEEEQ